MDSAPEPAANPLHTRRSAGVLVPLSSFRSRRNHGIGDTRDLYAFVDWVQDRGFSLIQFLPISPLSPEAPYPYSAYSAFGLDVAYIALDDLDDVRDSPAAQAALAQTGGEIEALRQADRLDYARICAFKRRILWEAYRHNLRHGRAHADFQAFRHSERGWLEEYALFSALKDHFGWAVPWQDWPAEIRERKIAALAHYRGELADGADFHAYAQWALHRQWEAVHAYARARGVFLMGDMPIYVASDSVELWAAREQFDNEADGGAPPDYFNWLGQNWAAPLYNWDRMKADGYAWWKARVRYNARVFDWLRFDHFRGISEYWRIPRRPAILEEIARETDKPRAAKEYEKIAWFWPIKFKFQFREKMSEPEWTGLPEGARLEVLKHVNAAWMPGPGEDFFRALLDVSHQERGTGWVVEDLGADLEAVHALRDRLGLAGMRVAQFFGYDEKGRPSPHVDPSAYPENAMAMTETHDTSTLREWIERLTLDERRRVAAVYGMPEGAAESIEDFERGILEGLFNSPARMVVVSMQALFGLGRGHRINTPGTVGPENWTWRVPARLEDLPALPYIEVLIRDTGRAPALKTRHESETAKLSS